MKVLLRALALLYVLLVLTTSCLFLLYFMRLWPFDDLNGILNTYSLSENVRLVLQISMGAVIVLTLAYYRAFLFETLREKTIAFDNPAGRVSVSLDAVEDLVRRSILKTPEVRDVFPSIKAKRKGLYVDIKLVLTSDVSIPEITGRVQEAAKKKIQDAIGLDEPIYVTVFVNKIVSDKTKDKQSGDKEYPNRVTNVPFQGYRA